MSKSRTFVVVLASFTVGIAVGVVCASWYWLDFNGRFMTASLVSRTQADIVTRVAALEHLRAGRTKDAERNLELLLDADLITVAALARDGHKLSATTLEALSHEHSARQAGAYEPSDPAIAAFVTEAFRLATQASDGAGPNKALKGDVAEATRP